MKRHDIICALLGIAFGGCVGFLATRKYFEEHYKTQAETIIDEYKRYVTEHYVKKDGEPIEDADPVEEEEDIEKQPVDKKKEQFETYRKLVQPYNTVMESGERYGRVDYTKPNLSEIAAKYQDAAEKMYAEMEHPEEEAGEEIEIPPEYFEPGEEYENEIVRRIETGTPRQDPYEISEDEYNDPALDATFAKEDLYWFEDGLIADIRDDVCEDAYKYLGNTLDDGGEDEDNWDFRYVRNEKLIMDFCIENRHQTFEDYLITKYGEADSRGI